MAPVFLSDIVMLAELSEWIFPMKTILAHPAFLSKDVLLSAAMQHGDLDLRNDKKGRELAIPTIASAKLISNGIHKY